jgi:hypothetical protein
VRLSTQTDPVEKSTKKTEKEEVGEKMRKNILVFLIGIYANVTERDADSEGKIEAKINDSSKI